MAGVIVQFCCALLLAGGWPPVVDITVSAAGDCTLGADEASPHACSFTAQFARYKDAPGHFFDAVKPLFEKDDITLVNLETTLTTATEKAEKLFRFRGDPACAQILKAGSVECVNVANNHTRDYLARGFADTLQSLEAADIEAFGMDREEVREVRGIRVGLLGFTGFAAGVDAEVARRVARMKNERGCAIVVVSFHWGDEGSHTPNDIQLHLGRKAIDAGADLVLGHHPHVIQGIERYKNKTIVYSLGNFCFGGNINPRDKACIVYQARFTCAAGILVAQEEKVIPCRISSIASRNDFRPTPLEGAEADKVMKRIARYTDQIGKKKSPPATPAQIAQ